MLVLSPAWSWARAGSDRITIIRLAAKVCLLRFSILELSVVYNSFTFASSLHRLSRRPAEVEPGSKCGAASLSPGKAEGSFPTQCQDYLRYEVGTPVTPCSSFDSPPWQLRQNCAALLPPVCGT